jgi:hypothetical protein
MALQEALYVQNRRDQTGYDNENNREVNHNLFDAASFEQPRGERGDSDVQSNQ